MIQANLETDYMHFFVCGHMYMNAFEFDACVINALLYDLQDLYHGMTQVNIGLVKCCDSKRLDKMLSKFVLFR